MSCEAIDAIFKCLQKLENGSKFIKSTEKHKEDLKFLLRYVKIHLKWKASFACGNMQNWVQDIETRLIQPSRNGSLSANILQDVILSLVGNNRIKEDLDRQCYSYYQDEFRGKLFSNRHVLIDELVMDCLDPLLDNLKHLIQLHDLNLQAVSIEKIKDIEEKLMSIRNLLDIIGKEFETQRQDELFKTSENLLTKVKVIIENAVNLSYKIWRQSNIFSMDKFMYDLLVMISYIEPEIRIVSFQFLQASERENLSILGIDLQALASVDSLLSNLEELKKDPNVGSIPLDYQLLDCLHRELSFLKYFLMDPCTKQRIEHEPNFSSLLLQVEGMAREAAPLACSFNDDQKKDEFANEMNLVAANLLAVVNLLKAKIRHMYETVQKPSISNFPRTPSLSFVDFVMKNLENLLEYRAGSIACVKSEIQTVLSELSSLSSFIRENIMNTKEDKHIARRFVDLAYEAECVTDLILASNFPNWHHMLWLYDVIEKIEHFNKESKEVCSKKMSDINLSYIHIPQQEYTRTGRTAWTAPQVVVGFEKEASMIIKQLIAGPKQLDIVSIVGLGGTGKTTLAKHVYNHPSVTADFQVFSWYCISQRYKKQDVLRKILDDVIEVSEEILKMNEEDLDLVLYRSLEGKKFLIVIDDIWSIEPWNDICNSFPDDDIGSRILFTSRRQDVALQANPRSVLHYLPLFTESESWALLHNKLFTYESCPEELCEIGMKIATKCKGLPFSVVLVAGILGKTERTYIHWRRVLNQLDELVCEDISTSCAYILEMSYKTLPDNLKACLLYHGAFPEDSEIPTWKLISLWIAEGFAQNTENQSQENVAEDYLMDLIDRNLVLIAQSKSTGGVKSCHVHDLVHEFCLKRAAEKNFLLVSKDLVSIEQYRHSCYCQENTLRGWMPDHGANIRSLFFFPNERSFNFCFDFSILAFVLKLIRVLDLERIPLKKDKFPTEIERLVHLRYLAIGGELDHLPSSVGKLWRLETLLVMGTKGEVKLPEVLLKLAHLKRIYVRNWATFEFPDTSETYLEFNSVQELSTLSVCVDDGTLEKISRKLRRLRKLKCILLESRDYRRNCDLSPILRLDELESLNMTYRGSSFRIDHRFELYFGSQLRKLTLSNFRLPWSRISRVGFLPNLQVLKLLSEACKGPIWEVPCDTFLRLKFLKLQNLDLEVWDADEKGFPFLQQLVVEGCRKLHMLPSCLSNIPTLNMIKLRRCSYFANMSAGEIGLPLDNFGLHDFKLHIQQEDFDIEDCISDSSFLQD